MLHVSQSLQEVLHALGYILYSPTWEEFLFLCTAVICVLCYLDGTSHYALCDRANQMSAIWKSQGLHFSGTTSFFHIQRICLKPHPLEWQNLTSFVALLARIHSSASFRGRERCHICLPSQFTLQSTSSLTWVLAAAFSCGWPSILSVGYYLVLQDSTSFPFYPKHHQQQVIVSHRLYWKFWGDAG